MAQLKDLLVSGSARFLNGIDIIGDLTLAGNLLPASNNTYTLGSGSYTLKAVYIGTDTTYGSKTQPIYWANGVPTTITTTVGSATSPVYLSGGVFTQTTYSLLATVNNGTANRMAWYGTARKIQSGNNIWTDGTKLGINMTSAPSNYNFQVNGASYFSNLITVAVGRENDVNNTRGIKIGDTYINAIAKELILQNNGAIRFGNNDWDYNQWAGLKYVHGSKSIYLGIADGSNFVANTPQTGGNVYIAACNLLPTVDFTSLTGTNLEHNAYNIGSQTLRWKNIYANTLLLQGPSNAGDFDNKNTPKIEFTYDNNAARSQPVYLSYTPADSYRAPYGLKVWSPTGTSPGAWFEVQGSIYTYSSQASSALQKGQLVIGSTSSKYNGSTGGKDVAFELWRGTNASWQIINTGGILKFKNNWASGAAQSTYSKDSLWLRCDTGAGAIPYLAIGQTDANTTYRLYVNGKTRASDEIQVSSPNAFRLSYDKYGVILRNDGSNFYFLLTSSGQAEAGGWNDLRPFSFNLATGRVDMNNGANVDYTNTRYKLSTSSFISSGRARALSGFTVDETIALWPSNSNEINFGGSYKENKDIWIGYRSVDGRPQPNAYHFGMKSNLASVYASKYYIMNSDGTNTGSYGSSTQPIYWNSGVPTAISSYSGNAATATKLQTGRSISLSTAVTATATTFDGSANISIPVTSVKEAYLSWGGRNLSGTFGPVDAGIVPQLGSNRFAFSTAQAPGITIEYSQDSGTTWTDYGSSNSDKANLFNGNTIFLQIGKRSTTGIDRSSDQIKVTVDISKVSVYTVLNKFIIYCSTNGSRGCYCTIQCRTVADRNSGANTWTTIADKVAISGWSGYNVINAYATVGGNSSQYGNIRFIFGCTSHPSAVTYGGLTIYSILCYGGVGWNTPSTLARQGNVYTYDANFNVTFPGTVKGTSFIGNATSSTTAAKLGRNGDVNVPMTFNWSGQNGQPYWLWGGNDGTNMYVYNPSNFNVNSATQISNGSQTLLLNNANVDAYGFGQVMLTKAGNSYYMYFNDGNNTATVPTVTLYGRNGSVHADLLTTSSGTAVNADKLDNWHLNEVKRSGYITSETANLSSYWFPIYKRTFNNDIYNDYTLDLWVTTGYGNYRGMLTMHIRQNGANNSGAYNFNADLYISGGNLIADKFKLFYNNSTGDIQLWGNVDARYGVYNYTVISETHRTSTNLVILGTLTASNFSSVQTQPGSGYSSKIATYQGHAARVRDSNNSQPISFTYSKNAQTSTSWLASWNGYELGSISPNNLGLVKKSGDTMTGILSNSTVTGGTWIKGTHEGAFRVTTATTAVANSHYQSWFSGKTPSGAWSIGILSGYNHMYFVYGSDANYNTSKNNTNPSLYFTSDSYIYASKVFGAVWNDYAEYRSMKKSAYPGYCVVENGDDTLSLSTEFMQKGAMIVSDTYGFAIGETKVCNTPIAVSGRVLAYTNEDREIYRNHIGDCVCAGPNGKICIMTHGEAVTNPEAIIGTISAVPDYEEWGSGNIKVDGRVWITIK